MGTTDFDLKMNQDILKFIFGGTITQPTAPIVSRWLAADDATSLTPGTEVSTGAATRVPLTFNSVTQYTSRPNMANCQVINEGYLLWPGTTADEYTLHGEEWWDSASPPRRISYDKGNLGFTVKGGDAFEWEGRSGGIALVGMGFDAAVLKDALNWALGKTTGWTRPVGPFKVKLIQDTDYVGVPKTTLENTPMQTVTFGAVGADGFNRATIKNNIAINWPIISDTNDAVINRYEIWDSSPTPRRIIDRRPGDDYVRDQNTSSFGYIAAGNGLNVPVGSLKIVLGRGDG